MTPRRIYRFDDADWHVPVSPGTDPDAAAEAGRQGAARKLLAQGDGGFYSQVVRLPPAFEAPEHSHDHAEIFMVLEGSFDMVVVAAHEPYGFVAGPDGLSFLVVRQGAAKFAATGS